MGKDHDFQKSLFCRRLVLITHHQLWLTLMEQISRSVHFSMENTENHVQNTKNKHSQADKRSLKYNQHPQTIICRSRSKSAERRRTRALRLFVVLLVKIGLSLVKA
jgi:hypothetical protein